MSIAVDPSGKVEIAVPFEQGKAPNGICFSPDYTKVYVIRGGGITVGDINGGKVANLRVFTDCMVDGVRCGPDGMRADKRRQYLVQLGGAPGLCRRDGVESGRAN